MHFPAGNLSFHEVPLLPHKYLTVSFGCKSDAGQRTTDKFLKDVKINLIFLPFYFKRALFPLFSFFGSPATMYSP